MITVYDQVEQGSDEWMDLRRGMVTASAIGRLISIVAPESTSTGCPTCLAAPGEPCISVARKAPTSIKSCHEPRVMAAMLLPPVYKTSQSDTAKATITRLVAERITGWTDPVYVNNDMMRGTLDEPMARKAYADRYGVEVSKVGLIVRDDWGFSIGCSPDGLVGDDGGLEIKSRLSRIQIATVLADEVPVENMAQIQTSLLSSGRKWWDYCSFCGGLPLYVKRVYPDPEWQHAIIAAVRNFEATAAEMVATYTERTAGLPATERTNYDLEIV